MLSGRGLVRVGVAEARIPGGQSKKDGGKQQVGDHTLTVKGKRRHIAAHQSGEVVRIQIVSQPYTEVADQEKSGRRYQGRPNNIEGLHAVLKKRAQEEHANVEGP